MNKLYPFLVFKRTVILALILISACQAIAQQRTVYSQYMFNGLALNPAYAGNQIQLSATAHYRKQWVNIEGAPSSLNATIHSGFDKRRLGLGLMVTKDQIGIHNDHGVYMSYAYKIPMKKGILSMGLQGGFNSLQSDFTRLSRVDFDDPVMGYNVTNFNPNFGTGLYYHTATSYVGLSVPYILNNKIIEGQEVLSYAREYRYYFLTAGKVFDVGPSVKFKPSTLLRLHEGSPIGYDINMNLILNEIVTFGASYRSIDALIFLFQVQATDNFGFGYAYDYTLSALNPHSRGSHEIMVNYRIRMSSKPCHAYF